MKSRAKSFKKPYNKALLIPGVLIIAALLTSGIHWYFKGNNVAIEDTKTARSLNKTSNSINYSPPKSTDNTANNTRKDSGTTTTPTLNDPATSPSTASVQLTRVTVDTADKELQVGALVNGADSGTCNLTASMAGQKSIIATSIVQRDVNNFDCAIFHIPFTQFPTSGNWNISVTVTTNGATSVATSQIVAIPDHQ